MGRLLYSLDSTIGIGLFLYSSIRRVIGWSKRRGSEEELIPATSEPRSIGKKISLRPKKIMLGSEMSFPFPYTRVVIIRYNVD